MCGCCQWIAERCYITERRRRRGKRTGGGRAVCLMLLLDCYPEKCAVIDRRIKKNKKQGVGERNNWEWARKRGGGERLLEDDE